MISILINAYACAPNMGSEPGMAWNWIVNLAKHCKVYVITEGEWQSEIEDALKELPINHNLHFYYNPVSTRIREMCWNQGDWRFYYYYKKWQKQTMHLSKDIIGKHHIDILHQLNMIGFREPGYLWKIKEKPFIWGPIDAKDKFPIAYLEKASFSLIFFTRLKNFVTVFQLKYQSRLKKAIRRADFVISASSDSAESFKKYFGIESILINETGCYINKVSDKINQSIENDEFHILWVGKFDFRKQLDLAIRSLSQVKSCTKIKLHIVGGDSNEEAPFVKLSENLGLKKNVIWHGKLPHRNVQQLMQKADLFFFTSVAEGTPHVILESIGNNLPVLCFNTCGQGDSVNKDVGLKIELTNPQQSAKDFASKIDELISNRTMIQQMAENCSLRQQELSWDNKAIEMTRLYHNMLEKNKN